MNKGLPRQLDADTRLDSITTKPGKIIIFHYTLTRLLRAQLPKLAIHNEMLPEMVQEIKASPLLAELKSKNPTFYYRFFDKDGVFTEECIITPDMYESAESKASASE